MVFEAVLNAQKAAYEHMLPGNSWVECHLRAERAVLTALHNAGLLVNGTVDEFVDNHLGPVFFPHGLGHLIGCDTHDAGGYIHGTPLRATRAGTNKLRTARVLEVGMVLTNEPGCYFIDALLEPALVDPNKSKFINTAVLERFRSFGGVRLEDVVLITENGPETLSTCPRTVSEIENVIAGGQWPPVKDECPELRRKWTRLSADASHMETFSL
jgi:Xaa-Pro dipeptidase